MGPPSAGPTRPGTRSCWPRCCGSGRTPMCRSGFFPWPATPGSSRSPGYTWAGGGSATAFAWPRSSSWPWDPPSPPLAAWSWRRRPFLVLLLVLLMLVDRWDRDDRVFTRTGVAVIAGRRRPGLAQGGGHRSGRRAVPLAAPAVGAAASVLAQVAGGGGRRGGAARPGRGRPRSWRGSRWWVPAIRRSWGATTRAAWSAGSCTWRPTGCGRCSRPRLPATLVPYLSPLPIHGHAPDVWKVLSWQVSILTVVGRGGVGSPAPRRRPSHRRRLSRRDALLARGQRTAGHPGPPDPGRLVCARRQGGRPGRVVPAPGSSVAGRAPSGSRLATSDRRRRRRARRWWPRR